MSDEGFLQRLKQRKVVEWTLAYLAGAWVVFEATGTAAEIWEISPAIFRSIHVLLFMGLFVAVILAWYHGEKGQQRLGRLEVVALTVVFVVFGGVLTWVGQATPPQDSVQVLAEDPGADFLEDLAGRTSLMVLPFENRSGVEGDQYFVDGMYDELITRLQALSQLRVISRTTSDQYRDSDKTAPEIHALHGIDYLVEGGVQRAGDRVRINVQLVDAATDDHLWAEVYDRDLTMESLLALQSEIVQMLAGALRLELGNQEVLEEARGTTTSLEAYELVLQAETEFDRDRRSGFRDRGEEALALLDQALEIDPEYSFAYYRIVDFETDLYGNGGMRSAERAVRIEAAVDHCFRLAPESPFTLRAMSWYQAQRGDYEEAIRWSRRASASLNGEDLYHRGRAIYEIGLGRWPAARRSLMACVTLSPLNADCWGQLVLANQWMRRFEEAELTDQRRVELLAWNVDRPRWAPALLSWVRDGDPRPLTQVVTAGEGAYFAYLKASAHLSAGQLNEALAFVDARGIGFQHNFWYMPLSLVRGLALEALGREQEANTEFARATEHLDAQASELPEDDRYHAALALALAMLGDTTRALSEAHRGLDLAPPPGQIRGWHSRLLAASTFAHLGQTGAALYAPLEALLSAPSLLSPAMLESHFLLGPLHDDPGFQALIDRERDRVF